MHLILYAKPGCHLCEGLQEKLEQITSVPIELEIRDITTREDWTHLYFYEIPVLFLVQQEKCSSEVMVAQSSESQNNPEEDSIPGEKIQLIRLPRLSPRANVQQLEAMLKQFF